MWRVGKKRTRCSRAVWLFWKLGIRPCQSRGDICAALSCACVHKQEMSPFDWGRDTHRAAIDHHPQTMDRSQHNFNLKHLRMSLTNYCFIYYFICRCPHL